MSAFVRWLALVPLLCLGASLAHASTWTDLWLTRDQQGQRLLDRRQPAQAARVFTDSRRRGYAELEAGHYAAAAQLLAPYKDADSQYNRGNALARAGKLEEALGAFDSALSASPGNRDIIKNRDLVEQALKRRNQRGQQQLGSHNGAGDQQRSANEQASGRTPDRGQPRQQQGQRQSSGGPQSSSQPRSQGNAGDHSASVAAQQQAEQRQHQPQPPRAQPGQAGAQEAQAERGQARAQQAQTQAAQPDSGQASADASTADSTSAPRPLAQTQQVQSGRIGTRAANPAGNSSDRDAVRGEMTPPGEQGKPATAALQPRQPPSEQALALDQWLRSIPDDSGELLQRKFMIEHLMRQRGNQP